MAKSKNKHKPYLEEDETPISFDIMTQNVIPFTPQPKKEVVVEEVRKPVTAPVHDNASEVKHEVQPIVIDMNNVNGMFLAKIRESRSLTVDGISAKTRIPKKYIHAIEADDYVNLPAPIYFRGFVQSYLREIGLFEQKLIIDALIALYQRKSQAG